MPGVIRTVVDAFAASGVDLAALGLAWARVIPTVMIVPAFGLRALPVPARAVLGLALAASIFPALAPVASSTSLPWALLAIGDTKAANTTDAAELAAYTTTASVILNLDETITKE